MKTMKLGDSIIRVSEEQTNVKLKLGYSFCPKELWKKNVRGNVGKLAKADKPKEAVVKAETSLKSTAKKSKASNKELIIRNA